MNTEKSLLISLRRWIGISTIIMIPVSLLFGALGGHWSNEYGVWYQSFSALYWTSGRNIFVSFLIMDAVFYILYKGYDWVDRLVNILTGIFLIGLVAFPSHSASVIFCNFPNTFELFPLIPDTICNKLHMICAIGVFIIQAFNLTFLFTKNKGEITDKKKQRNIVYYVCAGIGILLLIINQTVIGLENAGIFSARKTCIILTIQILAFADIGIAWLVKGESIKLLNDE